MLKARASEGPILVNKNLMKFNKDNCKVFCVGQTKLMQRLSLGTGWLESRCAEKDLRDLTVFLYSTLISLYVEYHVQFLFPHSTYEKNVDKLEQVQ